MDKIDCNCAETLIDFNDGEYCDRVQHRRGDCDYVVKRNRLIPEAERLTEEDTPKPFHKNPIAWNRHFTRHMEHLARTELL